MFEKAILWIILSLLVLSMLSGFAFAQDTNCSHDPVNPQFTDEFYAAQPLEEEIEDLNSDLATI